MNQYQALVSSIRIFIRKYDDIVLYISIAMSIAVQFIPDSIAWKHELLIASIYTGVVAIIFIVLDIRYSLEDKAKGTLFRNMFDAKETIFKQIDIIRRRKDSNEALKIHVIGFKLRAISALLHELLNEVKENNLVLYNTKFIIYYFDPNLFDELISPQTPTDIANELRQKYNEFRVIVKTNVRELMSYNTDPFFESKKVTIQCLSYDTAPSYWGFGIDKKITFIGPFTWNDDKHMFIGPQNPCVKVNSEDIGIVIQNYFYSRCEFFEAWSLTTTEDK